ncbi:ATP synthase F1 subunit delta, partial [Nocardia salmonicida]|uniref:ATP synthase F1 subunit delta n=1 Tax=Nocardia salmonicida TaxID=53431 RepID=UPI0033E8F404
QRWTATRDLADVLEHLGVVATVKSAGAESARLSDEIFGVGQLVKDNPDLRDALSDPARSGDDKRGLVRNLLEGKALPATIALAEQAIAGTHRTVGVALAAYQQVAADVHNQGVAEVRVAAPLSDDDQRRLTASLTRQYGRDVHLNVVVDPSVIGGMRVEIGDDIIDGTVSSRLDDARRKLAG